MTAPALAHSNGKKSAGKSATGRPFLAGTDWRRGRGPSKGAPNAGRPPDAFKEALRSLASRTDVLRRLETVLTSRRTSNSDFLAAYRFVTERAYGRPAQSIEGGNERKPLTVRFVREGWPS